MFTRFNNNMKIISGLVKKITLLLFICFIGGCETDKTVSLPDSIYSRIISYSDCKNLKSADPYDELPERQGCIEYHYDPGNKKLFLKHLNAIFNCCPGKIYSETNVSYDTLIIQEFEETPGCNCICFFDIDFEVDGLEPIDFYLKISEPYCIAQEPLIFKLNLKSQMNGTYCVDRNLY
jgi:hypothetical protein